ncbi:MAG: AsmA family protein, partial [Verrucomicrobiota bacterium]|nr:AsmA family protein [Verrucomicrobiota bacterium]
MKKLSRVLLFVAGGLLAILVAALLAVNLYVQSQRTHARIQEELSQRLGTTLRIQRISVTPWFGLKLTGITMPQTQPGISGDFLRADTFRLRIGLSSLFSGRLVINEISLVSPKVTWAQNADGKWRLPSSAPAKEEESAIESEPPLAQSPGPNESPIAAASTTPPVSPPAKGTETRSVSFTPEVRRVNLSQGDFHFLDEKGAPVASFDGVRFRSDFRSATELSGRATIKKISLRNRFFLNDLESPVEYDPDRVHFSEIHAQAGEGEITGEFDLHQAEEDSPFMAKVNFRGVQVDSVMSEAGGPAGMLKGRIEGKLDARGKTADANALNGVGEIYLRDGEVRRYSLLVALGQLLQLDDLAQLKLDQAYAKYHVTPGVVMVDD